MMDWTMASPQAAPTRDVRTRLIAPVEAVEDSGQMLRRDAAAGVADAEFHRLAVEGAKREADAPAGRRVPECVGQQVADGTPE